MSLLRAAYLALALCLTLPAVQVSAVATPPADEDVQSLGRRIAPFLQQYCLDCHSGEEAERGVDLDRPWGDLAAEYDVLENVQRVLRDRHMPPEDADQPDGAAANRIASVIGSELARFDLRNRRPGRVTIRRLNRQEYNNTIRDLVGIDFQPADDFPSDDVGEGFDNIGDVLSLPPLLMEKYLAAAEAVVEKLWQDEAARARLLPAETDDDASRRAAAQRNLRRFASRAFRRPVTDAELQRLWSLVRQAFEQGYSPEESFRVALQAVLASPHFLFRVELDPGAEDANGRRRLNDWEIASRLSYFLWSSMPDDELFGLARDGKLQAPDTLRDQVRRMLADPKAEALVENFAGQWLQLRSLDELTPAPEMFADFDDALRAAMRRESELLFLEIMREDRSILEFLGADFTFVNERLARHYGLDGVAGEQFRKVSQPPGRRGVLTNASILLLTSNPTRTSPVKRGKWILENILGEPPPPPPANVEQLDETAVDLGSLRERLEQHRANPACAVCHRQMDALGFGLENFDAVGAWRERDGRFPIDPAGTLPGGYEFSGPVQLLEILVNQKAAVFARCLTRKMLTYALGRGLQATDRGYIREIEKQLQERDYRFGVLVEGIVLSEPFLFREADEETR